MIQKCLTGRLILRLLWFLSVGILFSCSKSKCETWEYTMECQAFTSGACSLINPASKFLVVLCDDQLNGISPGASVVAVTDARRKVTRHYIRKVN